MKSGEKRLHHRLFSGLWNETCVQANLLDMGDPSPAAPAPAPAQGWGAGLRGKHRSSQRPKLREEKSKREKDRTSIGRQLDRARRQCRPCTHLTVKLEANRLRNRHLEVLSPETGCLLLMALRGAFEGGDFADFTAAAPAAPAADSFGDFVGRASK